MIRCSSWAVAVVFLLEKGEASVDEITNYIEKTDLSGLGEEGSTPDKTMRSILGNKTDKNGHQVFYCEGDDRYSLYFPEEIREHEDVKQVYDEMLKRKGTE